MSSGTLRCGLAGSILYLEATGLANAAVARRLQDQIPLWAADPNLSEIHLSLRECTGVDSTFMGTLVGLATRFRTENRTLHVLNAGSRIHHQMSEIGLTRILDLEEGEFEPNVEMIELDGARTTGTSAVPFIEEAHRRLARATPEGKAVFGPIVRQMEEDRKKGDGRKTR